MRDRGTRWIPLPTLLALGCLVGTTTGSMADDAPPAPPRFAAKDLRLEAQPPAVEGSRFRLRADLSPTPVAASGESSTLKLTATLNAKAGAAQCPLPGSVFFDGFDHP